MREKRGGECEVERRVFKREPKLRRSHAFLAIFGALNLGVMKAEVRMLRSDVAPAPDDKAAHDIKAVVASVLIENVRQRNGHTTDAGADIEHTVRGTKAEAD